MRGGRLRRGGIGAAIVAVLLVAACSPADKSGKFSIALGKTLKTTHPAEIDLATIDVPAWDDLFVFGAGTTRDDNCAALQLGWLECRTTMPGTVAAGEYFLVFRTKGRISRAERHAAGNGAFASEPAPLPQPIRRSEAKFRVLAGADSGGFRLVHEG